MQNGEPAAGKALDELGRLQADLRRLPRHQWDHYLWEFCRHFVQRRAAVAESRLVSADSASDAGDTAGA